MPEISSITSSKKETLLPKITLFDDNFSHHEYDPIKLGSSLASFPLESRWSSKFQWDRDNVHDVCVFTDNCIKNVRAINCKYKIAWILEPRSISPVVYNQILTFKDDFDLVLTHDEDLLRDLGSKGRFYLYSGSWVRDEDCKVYEKTKNISIVASTKVQTTGHKLRHEIIQKYAERCGIDVYGHGYNSLPYLLEAYRDYKFTIVIENTDKGIISEKLISPMLCGTIPLYWGTNKIHEYFPGIHQFHDIEQFEKSLYTIRNPDFYEHMKKFYTDSNFKRAKNSFLTEDVLWDETLKFYFER